MGQSVSRPSPFSSWPRSWYIRFPSRHCYKIQTIICKSANENSGVVTSSLLIYLFVLNTEIGLITCKLNGMLFNSLLSCNKYPVVRCHCWPNNMFHWSLNLQTSSMDSILHCSLQGYYTNTVFCLFQSPPSTQPVFLSNASYQIISIVGKS